MKKDDWWIICRIISILYALAILSIPILYVFHAGDFEAKKQLGEFVREHTFNMSFRVIGLVAFVFWIYNIVVWKKRKESIYNLLLLLFLNVLYAPIHYIKVFRDCKKFSK
jgi:hypothetical protein